MILFVNNNNNNSQDFVVAMGGGDGGGASSKLKKAVKKIFTLRTCSGSLCLTQQQTHLSPVSHSHNYSSCKNNNTISSEIAEQSYSTTTTSSNKNLCAICLDPLIYTSGSKAIFTAQCSHTFHFVCITSNIRHGSVTCPVCRAHWTQLPSNLSPLCPLHNPRGPVCRRSFFRSPQYDDPIETSTDQPRLSFSLLTHPSNGGAHYHCHHYYYLRVKLAHQPATDLVLVVSPCGRTHSSLVMRQVMALVVSSMRPIDRLAIVTWPRFSTLTRMTSHGKRVAIKIIDRIALHTARVEDDPMRGLEEGARILGGRAHGNPRSCIMHLTDDLSGSYYDHHRFEFPVAMYRFDVGGCSGYVVREFEGFLERTLGGRAEDIEMRVGEGENSVVVRIGEMRGGEERNVRLCGGGGDESGGVCVKYRYRDGRDGGCVRSGEVVVRIEGEEEKGDGTIDSRNYCAGNWDYGDSFVARR